MDMKTSISTLSLFNILNNLQVEIEVFTSIEKMLYPKFHLYKIDLDMDSVYCSIPHIIL